MNQGSLYTRLGLRLNLKSVERTLLDEQILGGASWIYVFGSAAPRRIGRGAVLGK